jgi:hypothetical protein
MNSTRRPASNQHPDFTRGGFPMLEPIPDLPAGIDGLRAKGAVSKGDYDRVFAPLVEGARRDGRRIRLLYHFAGDFDGFTPGGAWQDAALGMRHLRVFERCAVVSERDWILLATRAFATLLPCPTRAFRESEMSEALAWLSAPAAAPHVTHRLIEERGVLLVEPHGPLGVEDFDAIALTVDPWIESGRDLNGIVVNMRAFPGWESLGGFVRHMQFVRDHHRKIRRVALAADGKLAKLAPALVETFVAAEVRHFGFDEVERAIEWVGGGR